MTTLNPQMPKPTSVQTKMILGYYGTKIGFIALYAILTSALTWATIWSISPIHNATFENLSDGIGLLMFAFIGAHFVIKWLTIQSLSYHMSTGSAFWTILITCAVIAFSSGAPLEALLALAPLTTGALEASFFEWLQKQNAKKSSEESSV